MKYLWLLLLTSFVSLASADSKANDNFPLPVIREKFELRFSSFPDKIDGERALKTVVTVGKHFEEKLILDDNRHLKIKGTLQRPVDGQYQLTFSCEDKRANFANRYERDLKLIPNITKTWSVGSGVIFLYSALITRIQNPDSQKSADTNSLKNNRHATTGAEFAAELPVGAQVKREELVWGKEVDGLQLGIRLDFLNRPYAIGEMGAFTLAVRNIGAKTVTITRNSTDWTINPQVTTENDEQLSIPQQLYLFGPSYNLSSGGSTIAEILPGQVLEFATAHLDIGPMDRSNPALNVEPGKYKVTYSYRFAENSKTSDSQTSKQWIGSLTSGAVIIEVVAAKEQK